MANMLDLNPTDDTAVVLRGVSIPLASDVGRAFVSDVTRNAEELISDDEICEKYGLTTRTWKEIAEDPAVVRAVRADHARRVRNGAAAQESAAKLFATAPAVLGNILNNEYTSPRHRIEAARELRAAANIGPETATGSDEDRFRIVINLGADEKLVFDKKRGALTPDEARENRNDDAEG